jgi:hypothetical protein
MLMVLLSRSVPGDNAAQILLNIDLKVVIVYGSLEELHSCIV